MRRALTEREKARGWSPPIPQQHGLDLLESIPEGKVESVESPYARKFRAGRWKDVASLAYRNLARRSLFRERTDRVPFRAEAMEKSAALVGEYHVWKHTPRIDRDSDWPKTRASFCEGYGITTAQLDHLLTMTSYSRWEKRYLEYTDPEVRTAIIKDVLLAGAVRQLDAEEGKENANWVRTALQADGQIQGTQKVTQVNIGSNVLNMPEGVTREMLDARLEAVNRLAARMNAREVTNDHPERTSLPEHRGSQGSAPRAVPERPLHDEEPAVDSGPPDSAG